MGIISRDGTEFCRAKLRQSDGQFVFNVVQGRTNPVTTTAFAAKVERAPIELWHERLGHPSYEAVKKVESLVNNMEISTKEKPTVPCRGCQMGKGHRDAFLPSTTPHATTPFELVHVDIAGPMQTPTPDGARWFTLFVDDATRMHFVSLTATKKEVFTRLKELTARVENETEYRLVKVRSDGESVLESKESEAWFKEKGIVHEVTVPYTSQQNGVAEKGIRGVSEGAKAMIYGAQNLIDARSVDVRLWGEAVKTMAYLLNRTFRTTIPEKTPIEAFTGKRPSLAHLRVFGSSAYVHIPKKRRGGKFAPHRKLMIFVGYPDGIKGWRFFDPQAGAFVHAREAAFFELQRVETVDHELTEDEGRFEEVGDDDIGGKKGKDDGVGAPGHASGDSQHQFHPPGLTNTPKEKGEEPTGRSEDAAQAAEHEELVGAPVAAPVGGSEESVGAAPEAPTKAKESALPRVSRWADQPTRSLPKRANRFDGNYKKLSTGKQAVVSAFAATPAQTHIPLTFHEAMESENAEDWTKACASEMASLKLNGVWELVDLPAGRKAVKSKWVFDIKRDEKGNIERYKARLVAKGFSQVPGVDFTETYASVAKFPSIRAVLSIAATKDLEIFQVDAVTAFLNGEVEEELYMEQPEGFVEGDGGRVCRLRKAIYGLKQAGRQWKKRADEDITSMGFVASPSDDCVFTRNDGVILVVYVDDMLVFSRTKEEGSAVVDALEQLFPVKRIGEPKKFLGMEVTRDRQHRTIALRQTVYIQDVLERFGMADANSVSTPMVMGSVFGQDGEEADKKTYQSLVGSVMFLMLATRPDLAYSISSLSRYNANPKSDHLAAAKRILRYVKGTKEAGLTLGGSSLELEGLRRCGVRGRRCNRPLDVRLRVHARQWRNFVGVQAAAACGSVDYGGGVHWRIDGGTRGSMVEGAGGRTRRRHQPANANPRG